MSINEVQIKHSPYPPINKGDTILKIGHDDLGKDSGISEIYIRFNQHYFIDIKKKEDGEIVIILTTGGISKEIDLQSFHQLICMNKT